MSSFVGKLQQYIAEIVPEFLQGKNATTFLQAFGLTLDVSLQTLITGLRQAYPLKAFVDNLTTIGTDRGIRWYPTEPVQSYRLRLAKWRQIKRHSGSPLGTFINLQPFFLPGVLPALTIVYQCGDGSSSTYHRYASDGVYTVTRATPSNFQFDVATFRWSRFWLFIEETAEMAAAFPPALYDDGTVYDDGVTLYDGGAFSSARIADIVAAVNDNKAAHSMLAGVAVIRAGYSLNSAGVSTTLPDGSTTYPAGNWYLEADLVTGLPTRPEYITFLYVNPEA